MSMFFLVSSFVLAGVLLLILKTSKNKFKADALSIALLEKKVQELQNRVNTLNYALRYDDAQMRRDIAYGPGWDAVDKINKELLK
jgi:regulator of PEP synthase PpsR (kinase-PPPase family)